jgi:pimeloyl-ACP methyl ester carboxylesterase
VSAAVFRAAVRLALGAAVFVGCYWAFLFWVQRRLLFPAPPVAGAPRRPATAEQLWLETATGRTEAWLLPPATPSAAPVPLILFAHGNGELIDFWPAAFDEPRRWGLAVLLVEYPGYGRSPGLPSEATTTAAMVAAYDWARGHPGIDPARIIAYGRSVGGGIACQLAAHRPVAALVLESTFTSVRRFASGFGAPPFLVRDPFDSLAFVRGYRGPLLLVHGSRDDIIPASHGQALAAAAPQAELHLLDCGHNDCPRPWAQLHAFLDRHGLLPRAPAGAGDAGAAGAAGASLPRL